MKARHTLVLATLLLLAPVPLGTGATLGGYAPLSDNPCIGPGSRELLCPNLRIGSPTDLYIQHAGRGRVRLRATSNVKSRGRGPMELHGTRSGPRSMRVRQRIYETGRGHLTLPTRVTLHFTDVGEYFGGGYWKVHQLARFELWSVDGRRRPLHRVRIGPKLNYCLRDLERTRPRSSLAISLALPRLQPEPPPGPGHVGHVCWLVGHLSGRLRQAVDQRRRPARLLRLRDESRSSQPAFRVE